MDRLAALLEQIGASDCEDIGTGWWKQPFNAISSFAYVVVGFVIGSVALRLGTKRFDSLVFAASVAAIGLGSVAFHGPQPAGSRILHDLPILITLLFIVVHDVGLLVAAVRWMWLSVFALLSGAATALTVVDQDAAGVVMGALVVVILVLEVMILRRDLRPSTARAQRINAAMIVGVGAVGGVLWVLGRSSSPTCDPADLFQFHGTWHIVSSLVFGLWWWLAYDQGPAVSQDAELGSER